MASALSFTGHQSNTNLMFQGRSRQPPDAWHRRLPSASSQGRRPEAGALRCLSACACSGCCPRTRSCQGSPARPRLHRVKQRQSRTSFISLQIKMHVEPLTCDRAHSRTVMILSCSGWKHMPTLPIGCGSVTDVGKFPSQSSLPYRPFH